MTASASYCPLAWLHVCTNPTGRLMLCCEDMLESDFLGRREYHIVEELDAYWNSPYLAWVREKMLAGQRLRECEVCYREEALGLVSKRQSELRRWGVARGNPQICYVDLKLGNVCNLQCFMCDPNSSSRIAHEFRTLGWDVDPPFKVGQMGVPVVEVCREDLSWPGDVRLWRLLRRHLPNLSKIKFTGGEPLLSPLLPECLEEARRIGRRDFAVQVTTNATRIDDRCVSLLADFDCEIVVSLEGVGTVNDFIRYPSRWDEIVGNIARLREAGIRLRINATCSLFNVLYLPELIEFNHRMLESRLTMIPVVRPEIFDPSIAPRRLKDRVEVRIQRWAAATSVPLADGYARQILDRLAAGPSNPRLFERFKQYTRALCSHRGLAIERHLPELAEAMAESS